MPTPSTRLPLALLPSLWIDPDKGQTGAFVPVSLPGNTGSRLPTMITGLSKMTGRHHSKCVYL